MSTDTEDRFVDELLIQGEHKRFVARRHPLFAIPGIQRLVVLLALVLAGAALVDQEQVRMLAGVISLGLAGKALHDWLYWRRAVIVVTTDRVISSSGVFTKKSFDYTLGATDYRVERSFIGQLFGYGTFQILTANEASGTISFQRIGRVLQLYRAVEESRRAYHGRRSTGGEAFEAPEDAGSEA